MVVQSPEVRVARISNSGGSTGQGAEMVGRCARENRCKEQRIALETRFNRVPTFVQDSVNETALKINSGKFWLEAILAKVAPGKIRLDTLDNQTVRYTDSDGRYHSLIPVAVTSAYQSGRREMWPSAHFNFAR